MSLFGQNMVNNKSTSNLFSFNNQFDKASLFGNNNKETSIFKNNTNTLFGNNDIQKSVIFGCSKNNQTNTLFGNNNKPANIIFGFNNNSTFGGGLFSSKDNNKASGLFANKYNLNNEELFGAIINNGVQSKESNNDNQKIEVKIITNSSFDRNSIINKNFCFPQNYDEAINKENKSLKIPRNNMKNPFLKDRKQCIHENDFIFYNIDENDDGNGLLCHNCLYKYYKNGIKNCIPIKQNNFENYKKFYKNCINKYKVNLKKMFEKIISEIEEYEKEEIANISTLFNEKVNLKFELPVEIPFIERFEIAINRKIISLLKEKIFLNWKTNYNCVNLFENELKELKINKNNPNKKETIKIQSSIDFNISGIALPKISSSKENFMEVNLLCDNNILSKITNFESYENLSIGLFDKNIIKIKKNTDYFIEINGIKNLDYISNDEEYNKSTKLKINSNNQETILAALIIE